MKRRDLSARLSHEEGLANPQHQGIRRRACAKERGQQKPDHGLSNVLPQERLRSARVCFATIEGVSMRSAGLLISLALAGCGMPGVHPLRPLEIATAPYKGVATTALSGTLTYDGGCLVFRGDNQAVQLFPIWPDGTTFNGTSVIFHEPGRAEQRVVLTEEFLMAGQPLSWSSVPGPRMPLHQRRCGGQPFAVLGLRPAN